METNSSSGTTASILLVVDGPAYITHVGDTAVVLAAENLKYGEKTRSTIGGTYTYCIPQTR